MNKLREIAERMGDVAHELVAKLTPEQRKAAHWPFPSDEERQRWFYTPTDHGGLTLAQMSPTLQRLTMRLLSTGLSRAGYVTASTIIGLENVLDELEGFRVNFGRERGRDPTLYYLRIFGEPGAPTWSWRFGGHHVSVHHTILGGELRAFTPCFFGADPAVSPMLGPHTLRPLGASEDLAFQLLRSLSEEQKARVLISPVAPVDLVGGNRTVLREGDGPMHLNQIWRGEFNGELYERLNRMQANEEEKLGLTAQHIDALRYSTQPKGLAAGQMTPAQQEMLQALLATYVRRMPDAVADEQIKKITGEAFPALHLAWAGSDAPGRAHYYRIQGHRLLVEYDNTTRSANHVHTVWRDPVGDFGADALREHYRRDH
jgi:hypothetical protein